MRCVGLGAHETPPAQHAFVAEGYFVAANALNAKVAL